VRVGENKFQGWGSVRDKETNKGKSFLRNKGNNRERRIFVPVIRLHKGKKEAGRNVRGGKRSKELKKKPSFRCSRGRTTIYLNM